MREKLTIDGSSVTVVGVDTDEISSDTGELSTRDDDLSWSTILGAVTATTVKLTTTVYGVVLDGDCSGKTVVLDNLILGV